MSTQAGPFSAWERAIAFRYLRAKRSEGGVSTITTISFIGIMLAVFALITVMSVMNGFRSELMDKTLGFNGHFTLGGPGLQHADPTGVANQRAVARRLRAVPGVVDVTSIVESQALLQGNGGIVGIYARGVSGSDLRLLRQVSSGVLPRGAIDRFDDVDGPPVLIMGSRMADNLGVRAGDTVTLTSPAMGATAFGSLPGQVEFLVVGTFSVGMSQIDESFVYMPLTQAQALFGRGETLDKIEVHITDPDQVNLLRPQIQEAAGSEVIVRDWTQENRAYFSALQIERNVMRLILGVLVLIAAMNIISGLVMLVKNKGRDIAILRTMGASQGAILRIFFMAGATIGVAGTLCGFVLGVLFCLNIEAIQDFVEWVTGAQVFNADIYFLSHVPAKIEWAEVAIITLWSLGASFVFTIPPALNASRLDPVEALRYE